MQLNDHEIDLLYTLIAGGGATKVRGNVDQTKWEPLVGAGYIKSHSSSRASVVYTVTHAGREQLD